MLKAGAFLYARIRLTSHAAPRPRRCNLLEQRIAPELLRAIKLRPLIRLGKVVDEVLAAAREEQCDLIVMTSQASPVRRFFRGSFTERIARKALCPVLSMQPSAEVRTDKDERLAVRLIDKWAA